VVVFEAVVNAVDRTAPQAAIAFNMGAALLIAWSAAN
jgi:hypothetical protein